MIILKLEAIILGIYNPQKTENMKTNKTEVKYLILDSLGQRFRTNHGWIKPDDLLLKTEGLLSFDTRDKCDKYIIESKMIYCQSYGVTPSNKLFHLSSINK